MLSLYSMTEYIYNLWNSFLSFFNYNTLSLSDISEYIDRPNKLIEQLEELENNLDIDTVEIKTLKYLNIELNKYPLDRVVKYIEKLLKEAYSKKDFDINDILFNSNLKTLLLDLHKLSRITELKEEISWQIIKSCKSN